MKIVRARIKFIIYDKTILFSNNGSSFKKIIERCIRKVIDIEIVSVAIKLTTGDFIALVTYF